MSDMSTFLSAELTEIGLMAAADPNFAQRLIEALQRLPADLPVDLPVDEDSAAANRDTTLAHATAD